MIFFLKGLFLDLITSRSSAGKFSPLVLCAAAGSELDFLFVFVTHPKCRLKEHCKVTVAVILIPIISENACRLASRTKQAIYQGEAFYLMLNIWPAVLWKQCYTKNNDSFCSILLNIDFRQWRQTSNLSCVLKHRVQTTDTETEFSAR